MWPHIIIRIDPDLDRLTGSVFKLCFGFYVGVFMFCICFVSGRQPTR